MIIVRLMGGLGNQMFQYAAGLHLATLRGVPLKLDHSFLEDRTPRTNFMPRDYWLHLVGVTTPRAEQHEILRYRQQVEPQARSWWQKFKEERFPVHYHLEAAPPVFDPAFASLPRRTYMEGYFQDERYFGPCGGQLQEQFSRGLAALAHDEAAQKLATEIQSTGGIALHIRRGDYIHIGPTHAFHGVPSIAYYAKGLAKLRAAGAAGPVYVFSDDMAWCQEHLPGLDAQLRFVPETLGGPSGTTHLYLMSLCRHFVIANSSFAWWAAWLASDSPAKMVIRPAAWFRAAEFRNIHPCPASWIALEDEDSCLNAA